MESKSTEYGNDISPVDLRCSTACTRAGYLALICSALALALLTPLALETELNSLGQYVALRINLSDAVKKLEQDPCWQELSNKSAALDFDQTPFEKHLGLVCEYEGDGSKGHLSAPPPIPNQRNASIKMPDVQKDISKDNLPPGKVTGFRVSLSSSIIPLEEIDRLMTELGDGVRLASIRSNFPRFNYAIYRWAMLRDQMRSRNIVTLNNGESVGTRAPSTVPNYVPDYTPEEIHKLLTINNIRRLANMDQPDISDFERERGAVSAFSLPSVQLPVTSKIASTLVEAGILVALLYFWLYQQEAQQSRSFPAAGTLFGVLSRSVASRSLFVILVIVPPLAATFLALKSVTTYSYYYVNWIMATCSVVATIMIVWHSRLLFRK